MSDIDYSNDRATVTLTLAEWANVRACMLSWGAEAEKQGKTDLAVSYSGIGHEVNDQVEAWITDAKAEVVPGE